MTRSQETGPPCERREGHYWVRYRESPNWDVLYWRDGFFWDFNDAGYRPDDFAVGPQVFPPSLH